MRLKQVAAAFGATLLLGGGLLALGCQSSALASGKLYIKQQKYDQAREQLELAVEAEPANAEAHFQLGRICGLQGDYVELARAYDRAQELSADYDAQIAEERLHYWSRIYNDGVRAASGQGADLVTARRHFSTAVQVLPERLKAWRNLSAVDYQLGNIDDALAGYQHVLAAAPEDTSTARVMGVIYLNAQRYEEAVASFEHVLQYGEHHGVLINLAITQMDKGESAAATESLQRALALEPDCFTCHYNLGNLYWATEDHENARSNFERAVALKPGDLDARFNLAITYLALEELDSALPLLESLSEERPDDGVVWRELGRIYALTARIADSEAAYARAESLGQ
ncbi:MAG: tetratricopeptide repeat protein [Candidatus Latescibacteria bacterium]|jgi:superkiller protein 3|nr:tetratricopeptide repeat protein [Candidatus Latescibacterota bacterium]|tara:strand:- start:44 stop:1069 length:1026 start_codon:yes stop_codon:yes gene_type:complete